MGLFLGILGIKAFHEFVHCKVRRHQIVLATQEFSDDLATQKIDRYEINNFIKTINLFHDILIRIVLK